MRRGAKDRANSGRGPALRLSVVVSRYNATITDRLLDGAVRRCRQRTGRAPVVYDAPGAFELPSIARAAAGSGAFDAIVALGCIIKGQTSHDIHIARAVAHGLVDVTLLTGVPVAFGVLTVDTPRQAEARAGGRHGNKGEEAMDAAVDAAMTIRAARAGEPVRPATQVPARRDKVRSGRPGRARR